MCGERKNKSIMSRVRGCMMGPRVREMMTESMIRVMVGERMTSSTMSRVRGCLMGSRVREIVTKSGLRERWGMNTEVGEVVGSMGYMMDHMEV